MVQSNMASGRSRTADDTPIYLRIKQALVDLVADAGAHTAIPSERELAAQFGVARMTVRQATDELITEGRLYRVQGSGTYVAEAKFEQGLVLEGFSADMRARGQRPGSRTLSVSTASAGARAGAQLQISPGDPVIRLVRLRLASDLPVAIEESFLPEQLFPGFTEVWRDDSSLYETITTHYGVRLLSATQSVEATVLDDAEAELLEVAPLSPAFRFERTTVGRHQSWPGRAMRVEFVRSYYRGDMYRLVLDLRPESGGTPFPDLTRR